MILAASTSVVDRQIQLSSNINQPLQCYVIFSSSTKYSKFACLSGSKLLSCKDLPLYLLSLDLKWTKKVHNIFVLLTKTDLLKRKCVACEYGSILIYNLCKQIIMQLGQIFNATQDYGWLFFRARNIVTFLGISTQSHFYGFDNRQYSWVTTTLPCVYFNM